MNYQQSQRIEVIVRKDSGVSGEKGAKEKDAEEVANGETPTSDSDGGKQQKDNKSARFVRTNVTHLVAMTKQVATQSLNYWAAGIAYETGSESMQEAVQRKVEIVNDFGNIASSVAMGVAYGSAGGPIGMAVGAISMAVPTAVSTGLKYAGRARDYNFKAFQENNGIEYQRARAGLSLTTGRLR